MSFDERLQKAIQRGQRRGEAATQKQEAKKLSEEELKSLHSHYRLDLSEHIEDCIKRLSQHFPGFQHETLFGEKGWGAACYRDDTRLEGGRRNNDYSRLEMVIRPFASYHVLDLAGKGTVRNKEIFNRSHYKELDDVDVEEFRSLIDAWILEYAELYASLP